MPIPCILAHDLGTTGNKASLFDAEGRLLASVFAPYATSYPEPGWAEQEPADWWDAVSASTQDLLVRVPDVRSRLAGVAFSAMMNGCLLVDDRGVPLRPAMIHADIRSTVQCDRILHDVGEERAYNLTGNRVAPYFTLGKLAWLVDHEPDTVARARWAIQAKDYAAGRLTGVWGVTDRSDASLTGCFDMKNGSWSEEMAAAGRFPRRLLPEVRCSGSLIGRVTAEAAAVTDLPHGLPVIMGGGDGPCATAGAGAVQPGDAYHYLGGTSWVAAVTEGYRPDPTRRVSVFCGLDPTQFVIYGTVQSAGSSVDWIRGVLQEPFESLEQLAAAVPPGSRGLLFLPYLMGERSPIWDANARGVFFGLSSSHRRGEMARAVFEGAAFALASNLNVLEEMGLAPAEIRCLGGGMRSTLWRSILSAAYNRPLIPLARLTEATACGAAMAAAIGVGLCSDYTAAAPLFCPTAAREDPDAEAVEAYARAMPRFQRLYQALKESFRESAET